MSLLQLVVPVLVMHGLERILQICNDLIIALRLYSEHVSVGSPVRGARRAFPLPFFPVLAVRLSHSLDEDVALVQQCFDPGYARCNQVCGSGC